MLSERIIGNIPVLNLTTDNIAPNGIVRAWEQREINFVRSVKYVVDVFIKNIFQTYALQWTETQSQLNFPVAVLGVEAKPSMAVDVKRVYCS
jgi:hypothetical protein